MKIGQIQFGEIQFRKIVQCKSESTKRGISIAKYESKKYTSVSTHREIQTDKCKAENSIQGIEIGDTGRKNTNREIHVGQCKSNKCKS